MPESELDKWSSESGPFADNTTGAISAKTFRDFAAAVEAALEESSVETVAETRAAVEALIDSVGGGSSSTPFQIDPDTPESGWLIPSKVVLDALEYEGDPWSTGQHIQLKNGRSYFWDGSAWASGQNTEE